MSESAWTWEKSIEHDRVTWYGRRNGHTVAEVTRGTTGWQATIRGTGTESSGYLDQRSDYYRVPASAMAWAERYGRPRARARKR